MTLLMTNSRKPRSKGSKQENMQLYKTKMCDFHRTGKCNRGAGCTYAHSEAERRLEPDLSKTKLCKDFKAGRCLSQNCKFAHSQSELRIDGSAYKTSLCAKFDWGYGHCRATACPFAHSIEELRTLTVRQYRALRSVPRDEQERMSAELTTTDDASSTPGMSSKSGSVTSQKIVRPASISEHLPPKFDYIGGVTERLSSEHREEHQVVENDHCPVSFGSADVNIEGDDEHEEPPRPNCRHHAEDQVHGDREYGEVDVPPPLPSEGDQAYEEDGHSVDDTAPPYDCHFAANSMAEIVQEPGSADYVDGHQNRFYDDDDHESWQPPLKGDSQHPHANFANVYDDVPHQHPTTSSVVMPVAKTSTIPPAGIRRGQQQQVLPPVVMPYISPPVVFQGSPLREAAQSSVNSFDLPQQSHYHQQHSAQQWQEKNALLSDDSRSTSANSVQPIAYDPAAAAVVNTIYVPPLEMPPPEMAPSGAFPAFPDVHGGAAPPASSAITPVRSRPRADTAGSLYVSASPAIHPMHSLAQSVRFGPANVCVVTTTTNGQQSSSSGSTKANFTSSSANLASLSLPPSPMADGSQDASFRQQQPHPAWPPRGCQVATAPNSCHVVPLTSPKLGIDPRESPAAPVYIFSPPPPMMEFVDPHSGQLRSPPLHMATGCCLSSSSEELSRLPARQNYFSPVMAPVVWPTTAAGGSFIPATGLPPIMRGHSAQVLMAASPKSYDD